MSNQLNPRVRPGTDTGLKSNPTVLPSARSGSRLSLPPQASRIVLSSDAPAYNAPGCRYSIPAWYCWFYVGDLKLRPHVALISNTCAKPPLIPILGVVVSP